MANRSLFRSLIGRLIPSADVVNEAGGVAYAFSPRHALAQYAATGCLNGTYYADAASQLDTVLRLAAQVEPEFVARTAIYCRAHGHMKDMPALLCAILAARSPALLARVFPRVIDNARMLRNFVQIIRSGAVGRKSLGSLPQRLVREWLAARSDAALFCASVGQAPSLADIVRMVHPRPANPQREALYGYLIGRAVAQENLPPLVQGYEAFKERRSRDVPDVPFELLSALHLDTDGWVAVARHASWQTTRMNLNTFARQGVFAQAGLAELVAERLRDPQAIARARVLPYQLLAAYRTAGADVPCVVRDALQDALEIATQNVPAIAGQVYVLPDVSGSMSAPVTGFRQGATTAVRCVDVAALIAATILRRNPTAEVIPFESRVVSVKICPRDSVLTSAERLAALVRGGTSCSAPLTWLNRRRARGDLVIYISDNQSWVDHLGNRGTETLRQWSAFKTRNPRARLVCVDIQPYGSTQAHDGEDVLNVGGFSDHVFELVAAFAAGRLAAEHWVGRIEAVEL